MTQNIKESWFIIMMTSIAGLQQQDFAICMGR
jgi:hypothetical protein